MSRIRSELRIALAALPVALLLGGPAAAQDTPTRIVSHEVSLSRNAASLHIELSDGRTLDLGLDGGVASLNGAALGSAARGSELDRSWRELLNQVIDADADALPALLSGWTPAGTGDAGTALDRALEEAVSGAGSLAAPAAPGEPVPLTDSVIRLQQRIAELEAANARALRDELRESRDEWRPGPLHYLSRGFGNLVSVVIVFVVLMGLAIGIIFFGGRKYIENVADTARHQTTRSLLVGIAGSFLILPAFVLGIIGLAISIVGILALPVWIIGFPIALFGALVLGYLAIAHAGGEALAERRFYVNDWFQRGNSYYFIATGLGLLLALFVSSAVISMAGPWLRVISNLLTFFAIVLTWAAFTVGFGAVLVSRGGKFPRGVRPAEEQDLFTEEAGIS